MKNWIFFFHLSGDHWIKTGQVSKLRGDTNSGGKKLAHLMAALFGNIHCQNANFLIKLLSVWRHIKANSTVRDNGTAGEMFNDTN